MTPQLNYSDDYASKSPPKNKHPRFLPLWGTLVSLGLSCGILTLPANAAERLTVRLGPIERSVKVDDLEKFAETGKIPTALKIYAPLLTPQVREVLSRQLAIEPSVAEKFIDELLNSSDGDRLIEQLGVALPESSVEQLKAALYLAIRQANGLSALSFLRAYPEEDLVIDATAAVSIALQLNTSNLQSQLLAPVLEKELKVENDPKILASLPDVDPTQLGPETVRVRTIILRDRERERRINLELYYSENTRGPLILMSHGFASNRFFLNYLAEHLASYGFTVISLDHPGSDIDSIAEISLGLNPNDILPASEFLERPRDISFILDELERLSRYKSNFGAKINTEQVTIIGHSLGGYTALALAGAQLHPEALRSFCGQRKPLGRAPADWLQCAAADLAELVGKEPLSLKDERIVQAIALNPLVGEIFGEEGLQKIDKPVLLLTSSDDAITPSLEHQLKPFAKLPQEKYLLAAIGATHMSTNDIRNINSSMGKSSLVKEVMGAEAEPVRQMLRAISLAFIEQVTPRANTYEPFLQPTYVQSFSSPKIQLRFTEEIPPKLENWLAAVNFGGEKIARQSSEKPEPRKIAFFPLVPLISRWMARRKNVPQAEDCSREVNAYLSDILNKYDYKNLS